MTDDLFQTEGDDLNAINGSPLTFAVMTLLTGVFFDEVTLVIIHTEILIINPNVTLKSTCVIQMLRDR